MSEENKEAKPLPTTLAEFAADERTFLHDLANPLAIASGMFEAYREELKRTGRTPTETEEKKLTKVQTALNRMAERLKEHRLRMMKIQETP